MQITNRSSAKKVVEVVVGSRLAKTSVAELRVQLKHLGIEESDISSVVECVEQGFKAGTLAVVTGGASTKDIRFGESPIFDAAFHRGKAEMRFTSPSWVLLRILAPWLLLATAVLVAVVVYFSIT